MAALRRPALRDWKLIVESAQMLSASVLLL